MARLILDLRSLFSRDRSAKINEASDFFCPGPKVDEGLVVSAFLFNLC